MAFNSLTFLTKFLPIIIVLYFIVPKKYKNILLLIISLLLYSWQDPKYLALLIIMILCNYCFGGIINKHVGKKRKALLIEAIVINTVILGYFKYYQTFINGFLKITTIDATFQNIIAPLGISFFTFQGIAYLVDVYRKKIEPDKDLVSYGLAISFFPKIMMGPIIDYQEWKKQINNHPFSPTLFDIGAKRFIIGLSQKVILASTFAGIWQEVSTSDISMASAWLGIFAFSFQIYFDFAGYSHMAIGLANIFGFVLNENFNYPYSSRSILEFWKRWHISLGRWFKEYVYIPLGGNRVNKKRYCINILIVWILTGIWHGASLNFIAWGLYFGILVIVEKQYLYKKRLEWTNANNLLITFVLVMIGWVFFATNDIISAGQYLLKMINVGTIEVIDYTTLEYLKYYGIYFIMAIIISLPIFKNITTIAMNKYPKITSSIIVVGLLCILAISIAFIVSGGYQSFIYAQF